MSKKLTEAPFYFSLPICVLFSSERKSKGQEMKEKRDVGKELREAREGLEAMREEVEIGQTQSWVHP